MPCRNCGGRPSWTMNSARTMPWVLVFPPRSNPPGFQSPLICALKVSMIDCSEASSSGWIRSSAIFSPSFLRRRLISAVVRRAIGSRSTASKAGRIHGSTRRCNCSSRSDVSLIQLRTTELVLEGGTGRLVIEPNTFLCICIATPPSARGGEVTQRADAGQEEVGATLHGDELRQPAQPAVRTAGLRDREPVGRRIPRLRQPVAEQRIALAGEPVELAPDEPRALHELELALDVGREAHEMETYFRTGRIRRDEPRGGRAVPVLAPAAKQAMKARGGDQILVQRRRIESQDPPEAREESAPARRQIRIARIGPPDVRA